MRAYLLDTCILLRAFDGSSSEHSAIVSALRRLRDSDETMVVAAQNIAEFWNVSTRPTSANGYGLDSAGIARRVRLIEQFCPILTENVRSFQQWKLLVNNHHVSGVGVHDTRLVAVMHTEGISHLLTFNVRDFRRYQNLEVVTPQQVLAEFGS